MKSKIKYVNDVYNSKFISEIYGLITDSFQNNNINRIFGNVYYYGMLVYAKYIIERERIDYSKIIDGDIEELSGFLKERFNKLFPLPFIKNFKDAKLYEILKKMAFEDYEIPVYSDRFLDAYLDKNKKYLIISSYKIPYIAYSNVDIYDADMSPRLQFIYELFDEISILANFVMPFEYGITRDEKINIGLRFLGTIDEIPMMPGFETDNQVKKKSYNILNFNSIDLEC